MSLNTIQLQEFIVGELYKENLQVSPDGVPVARRPVPTSAPINAQPAAAPPQSTTPPSTSTAQPVTTPPQSIPAPQIAAPVTQPAAPSSPAKPSLGSIAAAMSQTSKTPPPVTAQPASSALQPAASQPTPSQPAASLPGDPTATPYKTLGNHRRKITILVNAPGSPFLPDNQLSFLTKILEACRLNMGDVAIVNHASAPVNITALRAQLQPSVILLFGLEPTTIRLPINFPVFKLQPYDQCTYLSVPGLDLLVQTSEESKLLKSKLWLCLKSLFEV